MVLVAGFDGVNVLEMVVIANAFQEPEVFRLQVLKPLKERSDSQILNLAIRTVIPEGGSWVGNI